MNNKFERSKADRNYLGFFANLTALQTYRATGVDGDFAIVNDSIYIWDTDTVAWKELAGWSGSGDVTGPASSTDNALVRFDGTTGKAIQNWVVTQSDNWDLAAVNSIALATSPVSAPTSEGSMYWNTTDKCLNINTGISWVVLNNGQETVLRVRNSTGSAIPNGSVVYISWATGNRPTVALARADSASTSTLIGMATENIADSSDGFVTTFGLVRDVDTSAYTENDSIYLSASVAGAFTNVPPSSPNYVIFIGRVTRVNASNGEILVNPVPFTDSTRSVESLRVHDTLNIIDLTQGSVPFIGASGTISQDNANFFWDDTNNRLGLLTSSPLVPFDMSTDPNWTIGTSPTPTVVASDTGGTVAAGTYYFKIVATFRGGFAAGGTESVGATVTTSTGSIAISWTPVAGVSFYEIYRTTTSGTYTSPTLIARTSASSFTWTDGVATAGAPIATNGQTIYGGKGWINDLFTSTGTQYSSYTINSVSSITANDTNTTNGFAVRKTVPASNPYNHGIQRGQQIINDFYGSGSSGAIQGSLIGATYYGSGSSVGQINGVVGSSSYLGTNTITSVSMSAFNGSATISSNGRATSIFWGLFTATVASAGSQNPTAGSVYWVRWNTFHTSTGKTVDAMYGYYGLNTISTTGGTATNVYGGYFGNTLTTGTITNSYWVYISTIDGTNKWGLYSSDTSATNYLGATTLIGTTTNDGVNKLQVSGGIYGSGDITVGTASATNGRVVLNNSTNANTVTVQPWATSASYTLTLPTAVASAGQVLTDVAGNGVLSWTTVSWLSWGSGISGSSGTGLTLTANNGAAGAFAISVAASVAAPSNAWNYVSLNDTQSAAHTAYYANLRTAPQAHIGYLASAPMVSTTAAAFKADMSTTGTGIGFQVIGGSNDFKIASNISSSTPVALTASTSFSGTNVTSSSSFVNFSKNITSTSGTLSDSSTTFLFRSFFDYSNASVTTVSLSGTIFNIDPRTNGTNAAISSISDTRTILSLNASSGSLSNWSGVMINGLHDTSSPNGTTLPLTARTSNVLNFRAQRISRHTSGTVADNYNGLYYKRDTQQNGAGGTFTSTGSVAKFENSVTQTAGTMTDSAVVLSLVQSDSSTGGHILFNSYSGAPTTDGTLWFDGTNFKARIGGVTKTFTLV